MSKFGERVQLIRGDLSRESFASKVGVSAKTIQRWENGENEPKVTDLVNFAHAAGVSVQWLATGEGGESEGPRPERVERGPVPGSNAPELIDLSPKRRGAIAGVPPEAQAMQESAGRSVSHDDINVGEEGTGQVTSYATQALLRGLKLRIAGEADIILDVLVRGPESHVVKPFLEMITSGAGSAVTPKPGDRGTGK